MSPRFLFYRFLINLFIAFVCIHTFWIYRISDIIQARSLDISMALLFGWMTIFLSSLVSVSLFRFWHYQKRIYVITYILCHYLFAYFGSHSAFYICHYVRGVQKIYKYRNMKWIKPRRKVNKKKQHVTQFICVYVCVHESYCI